MWCKVHQNLLNSKIFEMTIPILEEFGAWSLIKGMFINIYG
jgi:hypothetical protein